MKGIIFYILQIIILISCTINGYSQKVVFKYQFEKTDQIHYSSNGNYIVVNRNSNLLLVEMQGGNILAKTDRTKQFTGEINIIAFSPSDNGEYIVALTEIAGEFYLELFQYIGVGELYRSDEYLISRNNFSVSDGILFELLWKGNEEFILKEYTNIPDSKAFFYYHSFIIYSSLFYENFSVGNFENYDYGYLNGLKKSFLGYEISDDTRYLTLSTSLNTKDKWKKNNIEYSNFSYGVLEWGLENGQQIYHQGFPNNYYNDHSDTTGSFNLLLNHCLKEKEISWMNENNTNYLDKSKKDSLYTVWKSECSEFARDKEMDNYLLESQFDFEGGYNMYTLHYDASKNGLYGIANSNSLRSLLYTDFLNVENKYDLSKWKQIPELNSILGYYNNRNNMNSYIPFFYDLNSGKFSLWYDFHFDYPVIHPDSIFVDGNIKNNYQEYIEEKSNLISNPKEFYYAKNLPYLFVISNFSTGRIALCRINTESGVSEKIFFEDSIFNPTYTESNKFICMEKNSNGRKLVTIDLEKWFIESTKIIPARTNADIPKDLVFYKNESDKHLFIKFENTLVDYNFSAPPIHYLYGENASYSDAEKLANIKFDTAGNINSTEIYNWEMLPFFDKENMYNYNFTSWFFPEFHHNYIKGNSELIVTNLEPSEWNAKIPLYDNDYYKLFNTIVIADSPIGLNLDNPNIKLSNYLTSVNMYEWDTKSEKIFTVSENLIEKWNDSTLKCEFLYKLHENRIHCFDIMNNDSLMAAASDDGQISIWNYYSNKLLATLYTYNMGKDWVFILDDGYYYGTKTALKNISFAFNRTALPLEYFELKYNRPDIVLKRLGCKNDLLISAYKKAYEKRLQKIGLEEKMLAMEFNLPLINIINQHKLPAITNKDSIWLDLDIYDPNIPLRHVTIYNNGVASTISKNEIGTNKHQQISIPVALCKGSNNLEISVTNNVGVESYKRSLNIICNKNVPKKTKYIVSIGAGEYQNPNYNLTYAQKDASDFIDIFNADTSEFKIKSLEITGKKVSVNCLNEIHDFLAGSKIDDEILIFYAGHGLLDNQFEYYLGTYETDFNSPSNTAIKYNDLEDVLDHSVCQRKLIILDACHSGEFEKEDFSYDNQVASLNTGKVKFRSSGNNLSQNNEWTLTSIMRDVFIDLRKGNGSTVITSAGGGEFAIEGDEWSNGVFTYSLIMGIKLHQADLNLDRKIQVSELKEYVIKTVPSLTKGKQTPSSRIENEKSDFILFTY